jgi:TonB family protein
MEPRQVILYLVAIAVTPALAMEPEPECPPDLTPKIFIEPKHPTSPISYQTDNFITVKFRVEKDGTTSNHQVLDSSSRRFEHSTIEVVRQWRYEKRTYSCPHVARVVFSVEANLSGA